MTKTVKGVGRARHEAQRRHQQRTPLPPRSTEPVCPPDEYTEILRDATREDPKP